MGLIAGLLFWAVVGFVLGAICWALFLAFFGETLARVRNLFGADAGILTQAKADHLTEKMARRIYGDLQVDRFLKYGDDHVNPHNP